VDATSPNDSGSGSDAGGRVDASDAGHVEGGSDSGSDAGDSSDGGTDSSIASDSGKIDGSSGDASSNPDSGLPADSGSGDARSIDAGASIDSDGAVCPGSLVQGECTGTVCNPLIDNMSGPSATQIPFLPPSCAGSGYWFVFGGGSPAGTVTTPSPSSPFTYATLPGGPPSSGPTGASVGACFAGTTTPQQFKTSGLQVVLAQSAVAIGDAGTLPALIDGSAYQGIEFWLWQASDGLIPAPEFWVLAADQAETRGYGVCDASANSGPTECVGPVMTLAPQAGWHFWQVPWTSFVSLQNTGSGNETALDPTTLTGFTFQVQEQAPGATTGVPFNFCVLALSFY
jgi:hypothetical protein